MHSVLRCARSSADADQATTMAILSSLLTHVSPSAAFADELRTQLEAMPEAEAAIATATDRALPVPAF
jgi:hypothetical protein